MSSSLEILVTNDDCITAKGLKVLVDMLLPFGNVSVVAPEFPQSATSTAVSMGRPLTLRKLSREGEARWLSLDATPASCVKFALSEHFDGRRPDLVVSGINHGSNAATAANYSGTLGAVEEAAMAGLPAIGVSIDSYDPDADMFFVERLFPGIFKKLMAASADAEGVFYNVNFPSPELGAPRGVRVAERGLGHWEKEYERLTPDEEKAFGLEPEEGAEHFRIAGFFVSDTPESDLLTDSNLLAEGYVTIVAHNVDNSDHKENARLREMGFDEDLHNQTTCATTS